MAGKGGGAWKVAYADFVTAMMAFFLVMWICGQDQKIKRAVSYYFVDPFSSLGGSAKGPTRTGGLSESPNAGAVPDKESVALGTGRKSYSSEAEKSFATKLVGDWIQTDKEANQHWRQQAQRHQEQARQTKSANDRPADVDKKAAQQLAKQLRDEMIRGIPAQAGSPYQDILFELISGVNWKEVAEDLLAQ